MLPAKDEAVGIGKNVEAAFSGQGFCPRMCTSSTTAPATAREKSPARSA